ncbi:protein of unknown function DUF190 [Thermodesulfatator indicus DSM 15286]|uniref:Uncharacterized protein n=1 Tax=Thermodesulfatator indicus (strain DSM 15286 / JCM 11887 / CIR29812) TaxID=667014 RepID=F8ABD7_THEID|nr:DUF190 domain-containing protein [Thermodesulfatator indicus]AEH44447.1 protein of unknown function DUF190 [Thermodesulfatator indicus DSM 15286]
MNYKLLSIYIDEDEKGEKGLLYKEVLAFLTEKGIEGATVFKGVLGWGHDKIVHTVSILRASTGLPLKIEVIEKEEVIETLLPELQKIVHKGLITVTDIKVIHRP